MKMLYGGLDRPKYIPKPSCKWFPPACLSFPSLPPSLPPSYLTHHGPGQPLSALFVAPLPGQGAHKEAEMHTLPHVPPCKGREGGREGEKEGGREGGRTNRVGRGRHHFDGRPHDTEK